MWVAHDMNALRLPPLSPTYPIVLKRSIWKNLFGAYTQIATTPACLYGLFIWIQLDLTSFSSIWRRKVNKSRDIEDQLLLFLHLLYISFYRGNIYRGPQWCLRQFNLFLRPFFIRIIKLHSRWIIPVGIPLTLTMGSQR